MNQAGHQGRTETLLLVAGDHQAVPMGGSPDQPAGFQLLQGGLDQQQLLGAQGRRRIKPEPVGQLMANGQHPTGPD